MAVAFVQKNSGQSGTNSTGLTATLSAAPTTGNLLVFVMAGDKDTGALTLTGFTQVYALTSTSVSLYFAYKVSDGSETAISPTWANLSGTGNTYHYAEYQDASVSGNTWQVSGQASNPTNETNVTSWSTGTTGTITADGLAMALITLDSADSVTTGTTAWTNSYTARHTTLSSAGARGSTQLAEKTVTSGTTTETTFSYTASTSPRDQVSGAVVVFTKVSSDTILEARGTAAAHAAIPYTVSLTPQARGDAAAHGSVQYTQTIRAGTYAVAGVHGRAEVAHNVTVAVSGQAAAHARVPLVAGPNDLTVAVSGTAAAHGQAVAVQHLPAPVPPGRTYRVSVPSRVYEISGGVGVGLSKTFLTDESDDLDYRYDWTRVLEDGETIVTSVVEPPAAITAHDQVNGDETTDVWFTGGVPGVNYLIPNRITTSAGRTYERNIELKVRDR